MKLPLHLLLFTALLPSSDGIGGAKTHTSGHTGGVKGVNNNTIAGATAPPANKESLLESPHDSPSLMTNNNNYDSSSEEASAEESITFPTDGITQRDTQRDTHGIRDPDSTGSSSADGSSSSTTSPTTSPPTNKLYVLKRNGSKEPIFYDKIQSRIKSLAMNLSPFVDIAGITQRVVTGLYPGIRTKELDNLAAETAAYMSTQHPDYSRLAARISVSNLHKETSPSFSLTLKKLSSLVDPKTNQPCEIISPELMKVVDKFGDIIDR